MTIGQWVRLLFTGDAGTEGGDAPTDKPSDAQIAPFVTIFTIQAIAANPCIGTGVVINLSGQDLEMWNYWAGKNIAAMFLNTPAGKQLYSVYSGTITEIKIGPVTEKIGASSNLSTDELAAQWVTDGETGRLLISCIANGLIYKPVPTVSLFGVAGRRRALDRKFGRC